MGNAGIRGIASAMTNGIIGEEAQDDKLPEGDKYIGLTNVSQTQLIKVRNLTFAMQTLQSNCSFTVKCLENQY